MDGGFAERVQEASGPAEFVTLTLSSFTIIAKFARVASSATEADAVLRELLAEGSFNTASPSARTQGAASLRLLLTRCREAEVLPSLDGSNSGVSATAPVLSSPGQSSSWRKSWPNKLSAEQVPQLREDFENAYPTELLDTDTFPSARVLALAQKIYTSKEIRWIPWKFRISARAQDDHLLMRPKKVPRLAELSDLLLDEAPSREIHSGPISHDLLSQVFSLGATALSLVKACHLGTLKIYNRQFMRLCFPRLEAVFALLTWTRPNTPKDGHGR